MSTEKIANLQIFSQRLSASRRSAGLKSKDLAKIAGISAAYLSQLETGKRGNPANDLANKLASACGVTVDWLLGRDSNFTMLPKPQEIADLATLCNGQSVDLAGSGERHVVRSEPGSHGQPPAYHGEPWQPQWSITLGNMTDEQIVDMAAETVERLRGRERGPALAHLCHSVMDLLNELANRKRKAPPAPPLAVEDGADAEKAGKPDEPPPETAQDSV